MRGILLFLGVICFSLNSIAQVTLSLTAFDSTCENNGSILASASGSPDYTYELTGPITATLVNNGDVTFSSLVPGIYSVTVTDMNGDTDTQSVEVIGTYQPLDLTTTASPQTCPSINDGSITVTPIDGFGPYEYEIISGPELRPRSSANVFSNLPQGTYEIRIYDACLNFQTRTEIIMYTYVDMIKANFATAVSKEDCSTFSINVNFLFGKGDKEYRIISPVDYATPWQTSTYFAFPPDPLRRNITVEARDECGETVTGDYFYFPEFVFIEVDQSGCSSFDLFASTRRLVAPVEYVATNNDTGEVFTFSNEPPNAVLPGITYGNITLEATDACGVMVSRTETILGAPVSMDLIDPIITCNPGTSLEFIFESEMDMPGFPVTMTITSFPPEYTGPTSFVFTEPSPFRRLDDFPLGNYTFQLDDDCGNTDITNYEVTEVVVASFEETIIPQCAGSNIDVLFNINTTNTSHPTVNLRLEGTNTNFATTTLTNSGPGQWTGSFLNIPPGNYFLYTPCTDVVGLQPEIFTVDPVAVPVLSEDNGFVCANGTFIISGNIDDGVGPYMYEILSGPAGPTYPIGPQASPVFEGLPEPNGVDYRMRVIDACGNSASRDFSLSAFQLTFDQQGLNCGGEEFSMAISNPNEGVTYTWTLPDGSMFTGTSLDLGTVEASEAGTYTVSASINGSCELGTGTFRVFADCTSLPVTWLDFEAEVVNEAVQLKWATASEENNDYFVVERSEDGYSWEAIGEVAGNGTIETISYYNFVDQQPVFGHNYYRLRQVDYDAQYDYSTIVQAYVGTNELEVSLSPNPTDGVLNIYYNGGKRCDAVVYNITGQEVFRMEDLEFNGGIETLLLDIDAGMYFVVLSNSTGRIGYARLIKR